tara:strand:- start:203 stop:454 length:252 start_codon:yes stop_codon:yes gene_type:complete
MSHTIEFYQRSNYGSPPRVYIMDEQVAADLERLTGRKTHSLTDLDILTRLGAQFVEVADPRNSRRYGPAHGGISLVSRRRANQ